MTGDGTALALTLRPLRPVLADPEVLELCINRPGEAFVETRTGWRRVPLPFADFDWCSRLARLVANSTQQRIDETSPLLSAWLPEGERIQIVIPPATTSGCVAVAIRRPTAAVWSIEELARHGIFRDTAPAGGEIICDDEDLQRLLATRRFEEFMRLAVIRRKNILVSGPTGSGKTTWTKALIREIPDDERIITIEDARELALDGHPNHVRLYYSKDRQGLARVTPRQLLESCLRMKPDRILLAELRSDEAFDYLRNVNTGHPGSITSIHASSATMAFEQLVLLIKQNPSGRALARRDIRALLRASIDVVVQFGLDGHRRCIREVWFEPRSRSRRAGRVGAPQ
jgi:type IV secretion system protein VirB11